MNAHLAPDPDHLSTLEEADLHEALENLARLGEPGVRHLRRLSEHRIMGIIKETHFEGIVDRTIEVPGPVLSRVAKAARHSLNRHEGYLGFTPAEEAAIRSSF